MTNCPACGTSVGVGTNFCPNCGQKLPSLGETTTTLPQIVDQQPPMELSPDVERAVEALPPGSALLVVERGPDTGARYLLNSDTVAAGRHPDSDIFLDDITVSRHHATFARDRTGYILSDGGSLNGTYVNRVLIEGSVTLRTGDEVQIGKYRLVYVQGPHGMG